MRRKPSLPLSLSLGELSRQATWRQPRCTPRPRAVSSAQSGEPLLRMSCIGPCHFPSLAQSSLDSTRLFWRASPSVGRQRSGCSHVRSLSRTLSPCPCPGTVSLPLKANRPLIGLYVVIPPRSARLPHCHWCSQVFLCLLISPGTSQLIASSFLLLTTTTDAIILAFALFVSKPCKVPDILLSVLISTSRLLFSCRDVSCFIPHSPPSVFLFKIDHRAHCFLPLSL